MLKYLNVMDYQYHNTADILHIVIIAIVQVVQHSQGRMN